MRDVELINLDFSRTRFPCITDRLRIDPMTSSDVDWWLSSLTKKDRAIAFPEGLAPTAEWMEENIGSFCVARRGDRQIGTMSMYHGTASMEHPEIGFWIHYRYRDRRFAAEMLSGIMGVTDQRALMARCNEDNLASAHILRSAGFRMVDRDRKIDIYRVDLRNGRR